MLQPVTFQVGDPALELDLHQPRDGRDSEQRQRLFPSASQTGDVSIALGFSAGTLAIGQSATFEVLLSDDGSHLGDFSITQKSTRSTPGDTLTVSGLAVVPEPPSLVLMAVGSLLGLG